MLDAIRPQSAPARARRPSRAERGVRPRAARGAPHVLAAAALLAIASLVPRCALRAQEAGDRDGRPVVEDVRLRGVEHVDEQALREGLATRPTACRVMLYQPLCWVSDSPTFEDRRHLDPLEVERDELRIRLYYWRRGYRDARVSSRTEPTGDGVRVVFDVEEGPPTIVDVLRVRQSDSVLSASTIRRAMRLREGRPLDLVALDSSVALLYAALWSRGHADASVALDTSEVSDAANTAAVRVLVRPGPATTVERIVVVGNEAVSGRTVRRLMTLDAGKLYRRDAVIASQRNLFLSGLFRAVDILAPPAGDSSKVVEVRVSEADLRRLELSAGFNTADFAQLEMQFTRFNFLGGARRLALRAAAGNLLAPQLAVGAPFGTALDGIDDAERARFLRPTWRASLEFSQPWFLSPRNRVGASVFAHRRAVPGIVVDRGVGARLDATRELTADATATATAGYAFESTSVDASDVYFCVTYGVCVQSTVRSLSQRHTISPFSLVGGLDRTDDALDPTRGYRLRAEAEHASATTWSDFRYNRLSGEGAAYHPLGRRAVLAGRLRLGWVDALPGTDEAIGVRGLPESGIVHPRKRFFAGGSRSARGFGENQLGPRILTVSPAALTDTMLPDPCSTAQLASGACDPNRAGLSAAVFQPQPLGGTALVDASVEYRFRITDRLDGAAFVDAALIGTDTFTDLLGATGAITPGAGLRLETPVGPVRLDLGLRPTLVERLPVVTQVTTEDGETRLVRLDTQRRYDPTEARGGFLRQVVERLTLHLAIGPAF